MSWLSGSCSTTVADTGATENLPLRMIRLELASALSQMEEVEVNLDYHADELSVDPIERAILTSRTESVVKELRWLRTQFTHIAERTNQPGRWP